MSKELPAEVFMPPNMLKAKVGGTATGLDVAAVKRAEAAMETLKREFSDWIAIDIKKLGEAYDAFVASRQSRHAQRPVPRRPRPQGPSRQRSSFR